jgi:L-ribulose-5-phosphate 3-epimerase
MNNKQSRRQFLINSGVAVLGAGAGLSACSLTSTTARPEQDIFKISLAQWSLHRTFVGEKSWGETYNHYGNLDAFGAALRNEPEVIFKGKINHLDFAKMAKREFGIDAIEYVNTFFLGKARDVKYLQQMKTRAADEGVSSRLIMCDLEGDLGDPDAQRRTQAVENHHQWVEAAAYLGCSAIRVNAASKGSRAEQSKLAADGLRQLAEYADTFAIDVLVENHGGISSDGQWLASVMKAVDHPRLGTLPDFGNFKIDNNTSYDNYKGVDELMPTAKAVSAKSYDFDERGEETSLDYRRLMALVLKHGYHGYVGIEYEGDRLSELQGILATKKLLETIRQEHAAQS